MLTWLGRLAGPVGRLVRWTEWYDTKLPFVAVAWLLVASPGHDATSALSLPGATFVWMVLRTLGFSAFLLAFGYALNDWCDRRIDVQAGKANALATLGGAAAISLLGLLLAGGLWCAWPFFARADTGAVVLASYFLAVTYSAPPIRFKERRWLGLVTASLAQRCLPCALVFVSGGWLTPTSAVWTILMLAAGLRWMLAHQLADHANDLSTATRTFVTRIGPGPARRWLARFLVVELVACAWVVGACAFRRPLLVGVAALYVLVTGFLTRASGQGLWQMLSRPASAYVVLSDFYFVYLPLGLAAARAVENPQALWLLAGLLVWLNRHVARHLDELAGAVSSLAAARRQLRRTADDVAASGTVDPLATAVRAVLAQPATTRLLLTGAPDRTTLLGDGRWVCLPQFYPAGSPRASYRVELATGERFFVKMNADRGRIAREADACRLLCTRETRSFRVPEMLDADTGRDTARRLGGAWLVRVWLEGASVPTDRPGVLEQTAAIAAELHALEVDVPSLGRLVGVRVPPAVVLAQRARDRELADLRQALRLAHGEAADWFRILCSGLSATPVDGRVCLVHGDFQPNNILFPPPGSDQGGPPALIDWEYATIAHALTDVGRFIALEGAAVARRFLERYLTLVGDRAGPGGVPPGPAILTSAGVWLARWFVGRHQATTSNADRIAAARHVIEELRTLSKETGRWS